MNQNKIKKLDTPSLLRYYKKFTDTIYSGKITCEKHLADLQAIREAVTAEMWDRGIRIPV